MLVDPSKANERKVPRTFGGLLRAALVGNQPLAPDQVVYEHGSTDWFAHLEPERDAAETLAAVSTPAAVSTAAEPFAAEPRPVLPSQIALAPIVGGQRHSLARTSPSTLEGGDRIRHDHLWQSPNTDALLRGTIVHAFFEHIEWLDDGPPDVATLRTVGEGLLRTGAAQSSLKLEEMIEQFFANLNRPAATQLLHQSTYLESLGGVLPGFSQLASARLDVLVQNERPFAIREQNRMLTGNIDRLVLLSRNGTVVAAEVIDYKTDLIQSESQLMERMDFYRPQIDAYRRAIAAITGLALECIAARLFFVDAGELRSLA
jgi:hypothetical protein